MEKTIFVNSDVFENIPEYLFCGLTCICKHNPDEDCRHKWFSSAPKFTTIRVNTIITSTEKLTDIINYSITEESDRRGLKRPDVYQHAELPDCLVVAPWACTDAQLTKHEREIIVDAACGAAVLRGANVFAPGVLGMMPSTQEGEWVSIYTDSGRRCKRGLTVPFVDPGKVFVGNGIMRMSRSHLFQKDLHPKGVAVEVMLPASGVTAVEVPQPLGLLQNLPSIVCGRVVCPRPGDKVIDLCAAPGHKTTHLAALMENTGVLVALDKIPRKIEALKALCETMQADCVRAYAFDSTRAVSASAHASGSDWSPPFAPNTFDHVLLDAPCSALGQRPQISCKITSKQISSHPKLQRKLFTTAVQLVKPGGSLVYSTCSLTREENEDIVSWALGSFPQLELVPAVPLVGKPGIAQSSLCETDCQKVQRFGPPLGDSPEEDTIGFFIAKFVKVKL
ncbi:tRNA (cytosine(72)-C(5))-methyltransferase NSUN6 [Homalodisca vitripennis]|uniref:tRNA (cytosine(72)-C(5))-methyltransferase NSUN6 n=1 Tax=Homalodisca vitripennis TaxID=197043 RepID=UPI001EEC84D5|nr:tRNA (cytosine(72)-C(5))-methyltransferase NSUN6 [Homalodisca vitripennis]